MPRELAAVHQPLDVRRRRARFPGPGREHQQRRLVLGQARADARDRLFLVRAKRRRSRARHRTRRPVEQGSLRRRHQNACASSSMLSRSATLPSTCVTLIDLAGLLGLAATAPAAFSAAPTSTNLPFTATRASGSPSFSSGGTLSPPCIPTTPVPPHAGQAALSASRDLQK